MVKDGDETSNGFEAEDATQEAGFGFGDALCEAAKSGDLGKLEALLEGRDGGAGDAAAVDSNHGSTALMWAGWAGHVPCVGALLRKAVDPRLLNNTGTGTALHYAAGEHRWGAVAVLLGAMDDAAIGIKNKVGRSSPPHCLQLGFLLPCPPSPP